MDPDQKLKAKCKCCERIIEVTRLPTFENCEPYENVIKRGNIVCWHCFSRLTRRWQ